MLLLTGLDVRAIIHFRSSNTAQASVLPEMDDALKRVEAVEAERDDALRHVEAFKASLSTEGTELQTGWGATRELQAKHDAVL